MAYIPLTTAQIASGEPVTNDLATKIKDNFDDHERRLQTFEVGSSVTLPCITLRVNGPYSYYGVKDGVLKTTSSFNMEITGVRILIDKAGTANGTEIDLKWRRAGGAYTSIFTTKPSVLFSAGDDAVSSNAVLSGTNKFLEAGDILRLDLTGIQTGGSGFTVRIDYVKV